MKRAWPRAFLVAFVSLGLALVLATCGDDGGTTTPTPTTPTTAPPTTLAASRTILEGNETIPARQLFYGDVVLDSAGRVDVTVSYTHPEDEVLIWLTDRKCSPQMFENDNCDYLTKSLEGSSPRTLTASSVAAGTYTLVIDNEGPQDEQIHYTVALRP